jgi:hypothetical protein
MGQHPGDSTLSLLGSSRRARGAPLRAFLLLCDRMEVGPNREDPVRHIIQISEYIYIWLERERSIYRKEPTDIDAHRSCAVDVPRGLDPGVSHGAAVGPSPSSSRDTHAADKQAQRYRRGCNRQEEMLASH